MRIAYPAPLITILLTAFIVCGCQSGPTIPDSNPPTMQSAVQTHQCLGLYSLVIDTESIKIDVLPARLGQLHLNVTGILNNTMGVSAAGVPSEHDPPNGLFVFDISLTHPFATKPQFAGFDVKGILMTPGTLPVGSFVFANVDETRLENADGYTRWWNPTEFTTPGMFGYTPGLLANGSPNDLTVTVNPYKYFADILNPNDPVAPVYNEPMDSDAGRGVFTAGTTNTRRYRIRFPMDPGPQVVFGYAIDASWAAPVPNPPAEIPDDFPIEANQPEAYYVHAHPLVNTLYYDTETDNSGGVLRLQVNVHDWQGQITGTIPGEVDTVRISAPHLYPGDVDAVFLNETPIKARYTADLTGIAIPPGPGQALIAVRAASNGGPSYDQGTGPAPDEDVAGWTAFVLDIIDPECTADTNNDWIDAVEFDLGDYVTDQLCAPTDYRDFYTFSIPPGYEADGELVLWCDAEPTDLELYDSSQNLITESSVTAGQASIDLTALELPPTSFFVRIYTSDDSFPAPYLLEFDGELVDVAPSNPVEIPTEELYVDPSVVIWEGNYLYLVGVVGLWVYDATDPSNPQQLSHIRRLIGDNLAHYGNYIYFNDDQMDSAGGQLCLIDLTDPYSPVIHEGLMSFSYQLPAMVMNSTHLYTADRSEFPDTLITIYDWATDPLNPTEVGKFTLTPSYVDLLRLIDPEGPETTLVIGYNTEMFTYEVEDPAAPLSTGHYTCTTLHDMVVDGSYLCCTGDDMMVTGGLFTVSYSKPVGLVPMGAVDTPGFARFIDVNWPYAFIGDGDMGFAVCDMTNPWVPTYIGSTLLVSGCNDVAISGNSVCVLPGGAGFEILDVTNVSSPTSLYLTHVVNFPLMGGLVDDYLIVNEANQSYWAIKTINIEDPSNAYLDGELLTTSRPSYFRVYPEDDIAVAGGGPVWMILDISDPTNILVSHTEAIGDNVKALALNGDALYVASGSDLDTWDIDPLPPAHQSNTGIPSDTFWLEISGDFMYVSNMPIMVLSILNPYIPSTAGMYIPTALPAQLAAQGDKLYIAGEDRLEIADLTNPNAPTFLGSVLVATPPAESGTLVLDGQYAYMGGLIDPTICNIWPPDDPSIFDTIELPHMRFGAFMSIRDDILYQCGFPGGLLIFDLL